MAPRNPDVCPKHSGLEVKASGSIAILVVVLGLVSYQVFVQSPNVQVELATMRGDMKAMKDQVAFLTADRERLQQQVSLLSGRN